MPKYDEDLEKWLKEDKKERQKCDDKNYALKTLASASKYRILQERNKKILTVIMESKYKPIIVMIDGKPYTRSVNFSLARKTKHENEMKDLRRFYNSNIGCFSN